MTILILANQKVGLAPSAQHFSQYVLNYFWKNNMIRILSKLNLSMISTLHWNIKVNTACTSMYIRYWLELLYKKYQIIELVRISSHNIFWSLSLLMRKHILLTDNVLGSFMYSVNMLFGRGVGMRKNIDTEDWLGEIEELE